MYAQLPIAPLFYIHTAQKSMDSQSSDAPATFSFWFLHTDFPDVDYHERFDVYYYQIIRENIDTGDLF